MNTCSLSLDWSEDFVLALLTEPRDDVFLLRLFISEGFLLRERLTTANLRLEASPFPECRCPIGEDEVVGSLEFRIYFTYFKLGHVILY